jgi:transcriptional regulator with XRE-family HTH domain
MRIKSRRKELKLSQRTLAKMCGYANGSSITLIESGRRNLVISKIERLAAALYTTPEQLIHNDLKNELVTYSLTEWELQLLSKTSNLNNNGRNKIMQTAVDTSELSKYTKQTIPTPGN